MPLGLPHQKGLLGKGEYSPEKASLDQRPRDCRVRRANGISSGGKRYCLSTTTLRLEAARPSSRNYHTVVSRDVVSTVLKGK